MSKPFFEQAKSTWGCLAATGVQAAPNPRGCRAATRGLVSAREHITGLSFPEDRPMHLSPLAGNSRSCWGNLKEPGVSRIFPRAAEERRSGIQGHPVPDWEGGCLRVCVSCCLGSLHPQPQFPGEGGGWVKSRAPPPSGFTVRGAGRGVACKPGHQGLSGDLSRAPRDRAGGAGRAAAAGRGPGLQRGAGLGPATGARGGIGRRGGAEPLSAAGTVSCVLPRPGLPAPAALCVRVSQVPLGTVPSPVCAGPALG